MCEQEMCVYEFDDARNTFFCKIPGKTGCFGNETSARLQTKQYNAPSREQASDVITSSRDE